MTRQRRSGTRPPDHTLASALFCTASVFAAAPPPREQWAFHLCPHPGETKACYIYEYSVESLPIKAEVEAARSRRFQIESASVKKKIDDFWRSDPHPGGDFGSLENQEWFKRFQQSVPEARFGTKLKHDLHFLIDCEVFPSKHWLEIPRGERQGIAGAFYPNSGRMYSVFDPERREATPLSIQPLKEFLTSPLFSLTSPDGQSISQLLCENEFVFSPNWERSDSKLSADFRQWLKESRPKNRPALELTRQSPSRRTNAKDRLKQLTALRLIRHFENNVQEARAYYYAQTEVLLYRDDSAWRKAEMKAWEEIRRFDHLVE